MPQARDLYLHLLGDDGQPVQTVRIAGFDREVELDEWFQIEEKPCRVVHIDSEQGNLEVYLRPIKKTEIN